MNKSKTPPDYIKILYVLYVIISLTVMAIFFFTSTPSLDEYFGLNSVGMWGTMLAALIVIILAIGLTLRIKK